MNETDELKKRINKLRSVLRQIKDEPRFFPPNLVISEQIVLWKWFDSHHKWLSETALKIDDRLEGEK